jgi:type II secretory ATPase GspE/PulE/Tfp pilus assembly ATPase PilB-like protein
VLNDRLRQMIVDRQPLDALRTTAQSAGMVALSDSAWTLAAEGTTSIAEVTRVVGSRDA